MPRPLLTPTAPPVSTVLCPDATVQQTACTTVAAAYRDADHARLARCRRTRADRDRAARARARRAGAEHQYAAHASGASIRSPDRDRAARRGRCPEHRSVHPQRRPLPMPVLCPDATVSRPPAPLSPLPTVMLITPALPDVPPAPEPIEIEPLVPPEPIVPELEHQYAAHAQRTSIRSPDRDRAARRGDALTTAHTHSAACEYRALSGCHRQQTACDTPLPCADHAAYRDADRAAGARARRAGAEHQYAAHASVASIRDRDRAARRGDARSHPQRRPWCSTGGMPSGCHRQQYACSRRCLEIEPVVQRPLTPFASIRSPDRDRARRGDAPARRRCRERSTPLTPSLTPTAPPVMLCPDATVSRPPAPLLPLPTVMLITPALPMSPHPSRSRSSRWCPSSSCRS